MVMGGRERGLARGIRSQPDLIGQAAIKLASPRAPIDAKKRVSRWHPSLVPSQTPPPARHCRPSRSPPQNLACAT